MSMLVLPRYLLSLSPLLTKKLLLLRLLVRRLLEKNDRRLLRAGDSAGDSDCGELYS